MKKILSLILCLALLACLTGCGANSNTAVKTSAMYAAGPVAPMEEAAAMDMAVANDMTGSTGATALPENRKWIITINMDVETEDLDALLEQLDGQIAEFGGYVENQNIHNGSNYASHRYRSANLTVRIPVDHAEQFTGSVAVTT